MDNQKRKLILDRALEVFARHGYRRTSMNDIAEAAGVSRPGLYLYFQSKEQIFNDAIDRQSVRLVEEIGVGLDLHAATEARLLHAFEIWTIRGFDANRTSPEAQEIADAAPVLAKEAHKVAYHRFESLLASILDAECGTARPRLPSDETAHLLASAMRGFKLVAQNSMELREMIGSLISLALHEPKTTPPLAHKPAASRTRRKN
ncbi:TetR/AcrR family transcriptional regulator [Burkholderia gladioli]|uniref:TetR/AcrR family transcriptional regulator n=1 Tax=Burkholderia gladioli TaxID=28095 RepID=UPI0016413D58|nr:TetR/AcrR family transcriptional regulator [Burkholderia gladioli]